MALHEPWWPLRWLGTSRPGYVRALVDLPGLKIPMVVGHDQDADVYWIYTQTTIPNARCEDLLHVRCWLLNHVLTHGVIHGPTEKAQASPHADPPD